MTLPIKHIVLHATPSQLNAAVAWTSDHLHVPESEVSDDVAVAYVVRHFKSGQLEGWDGFIEDTAIPPKPEGMSAGEFVNLVCNGPNWNR